MGSFGGRAAKAETYALRAESRADLAELKADRAVLYDVVAVEHAALSIAQTSIL